MYYFCYYIIRKVTNQNKSLPVMIVVRDVSRSLRYEMLSEMICKTCLQKRKMATNNKTNQCWL